MKSIILLSLLFISMLARANSNSDLMAHNTLQNIHRLNSAQSMINPEPECIECSRPKIQYDSCNEKNNYLDKSIENMGTNPIISKLVNLAPANPTITTCIRESMKQIGRGVKQVNCTKDQKSYPSYIDRKTNKKRIRFAASPCISESIVKVTQNAFEMVTDCTSSYVTDSHSDSAKRSHARASFALVNMESGFFMNSVSHTGAGGVAQLTGVAIEELNKMKKNEGFPQMLDVIKSSPNKSCQAIAQMNLQPMQHSFRNSCDRVSLDKGHPILGYLYKVAHQKSVRNGIQKEINSDPFLKSLIQKLPPEKQEELMSALTLWGHNTGANGIKRPFSHFANSTRGQQLLAEGQIDQFMQSLSGYVVAHNVVSNSERGLAHKNDRVREIRNFYTDAINKRNLIEKSLGSNSSGGKICTL